MIFAKLPIRARLLAGFFIAMSICAAQAQWQVPNHAFPLGKGPGITGFGYMGPGTVKGRPVVSGDTSTDPALATGQIYAAAYVVADGSTDDFAALQSAITAASGKELVLPSGTIAVTIPSAATFATPGAGTVIRGAGKYATTIAFNIGANSGFSLFSLVNAGVTFRDLTIQITATQGSFTSGGQTLFSVAADRLKFQNVRLIGNTVEGVVIGGTATAADAVRLTFTSSALAGSPITVSYTVGAGNTTAQIATGLAAAVNANATLSAAGVVATATGSFVGIAQASTLSPQATFTGSVTGAATETVTAQSSTGQIVWTVGGNADDFEAIHPDVSGFNWVALKANASTATNRRWKFVGGHYDNNVNGHVSLNSPNGTMEDVLIEGVSLGRVGTNSDNALPISLAHVTSGRVVGNSCAGSPTINKNVIHIEEASDGLAIEGNVCRFVTSAAYGLGYAGTGIFVTDNNVSGSYKPVKAASVIGNTLHNTSTNTSGYGIWVSTISAASSLWNIQGNQWLGFSADGVVPNTDSSNLYAGNFGASYDGSSPYFSTATVPARKLRLLGSASGTLDIVAPAAAGANTLTFPAATTDFSATGGTSQFVKQNTIGGALTPTRPTCSDLSDSGVGCSTAGAALSKTDDTNVTLTLGGTPLTALLRATSLTLGWTGQLAVSRGGTGQSTLTANAFLTGNGTSGINQVAITGLVLGNGASAPSAYAGTSCTNQFVRSLSAAGAATCNSVAIGSDVSGLGTNVATWLATPSSANLAAALTDETGSGAAVFATSPTLVTPVLGAASASYVNLTGSTAPTNGVYSPSANTVGISVQGALAARFESVGVPGNYPVLSASTTGAMALYAAGASANIDWTMSTKGGSSNYILYGNSFTSVWFWVAGTASAVNAWKVLPSTTGNPIEAQAYGSDTNIDIKLTPKGTGVVTSTTAFSASTYLKTGSTTVGSLPTCNAGAKGTRYYVTDANATTFASTVTGGGANNVPVNCNGTNWIIGSLAPANDNTPTLPMAA